MQQITAFNLDNWLESWARWCKRGRLTSSCSSADFGRVGSGTKSSNENYDEVEFRIELLVGQLSVTDSVCAEALRLDYFSRQKQPARAKLLSVSVATYRRKVSKAKAYILEHINAR